ncbi:MAG: hypothetical protein ABI574_15645 [Burkholderiales bacterium]
MTEAGAVNGGPVRPILPVRSFGPRGLSLIETLIALLVLSAGLAALARVQTWLWLGADLARQRADALRLAQENLEQLGTFTRLDTGVGEFAWADIGAQSETAINDRAAATVYRLSRSAVSQAQPTLKTATVQVQWTDRSGADTSLWLTSAWPALDPRATGWLAFAPDGRRHAAPLGRHPTIPLAAHDLGDGRSAFKPLPDRTTTWVFDHSSGQITQRCDTAVGLANADLTLASLSACITFDAFLLAGTVRFATGTPTPGPAEAEHPASSTLPLDLQLTLSSTGHPDPAWECLDNAPANTSSAQTAVRYWCVVRPAGSPPRWSGRLNIVPVGWTLAASGAGSLRACRYSADHDGNGRIDNVEHPASYSQVAGALLNQNFLVVPSDATCPLDLPVNLTTSGTPNLVDDSTVAHQP